MRRGPSGKQIGYHYLTDNSNARGMGTSISRATPKAHFKYAQ
jgi:hypothetical protein